jgi:UDP-N-acetylglucosamine 2-epimerase (non-hydrolysing)
MCVRVHSVGADASPMYTVSTMDSQDRAGPAPSRLASRYSRWIALGQTAIGASQNGAWSIVRIATVFGTRPEAIKLAPVILAFKQESDIDFRVYATAQHREMLDQVLDIFDIQPDVDLNLMAPDQSLAGLTSRCVEEVDRCLEEEQPDLILVQGDTTTVMCAALAAFYRRIPVAHVEAGLRTWNLQAPWPEEANRVVTSRLATLHFAPTKSARRNLLAEGVDADVVMVTGNTIVDALFLALKKVRVTPPAIPGLPEFLRQDRGHVPRIVLITGHRRESFGQGFENICRSIIDLASRFPDVHFVYPVHLNPNVRGPVSEMLGNAGSRASSGSRRNIHLLEPLSYLAFVWLMNRSTLILTDSGGVQEEAPSLGKPVLVMRAATERPEAVEAGTARVVGDDRDRIVWEVSRLLTDAGAYAAMARAHNPYGDGRAAERIVRGCRAYLDRHVPDDSVGTDVETTYSPRAAGDGR